MALQLSMASPSTGELFTSTFDDFNGQGIVPTTPASASHPFLALWKEHLAELTSNQAGPYDTVIDAFVSLTEGSPTWREEEGMTESVIAAKMSGMRDLLSHHPPNVAVVSGVPELYSFHPRRPHFWHFICISEEYVKLWVDSDNRSDESARNRRSEKLALTALLKTSLDHEIGHWLFTLKTGRYSDAENISKLHSPPSTWSAQEEAGNFVEVRSRGGILTYSKEMKKAMLQTGPQPADHHILPLSYLRVYGNNHSIRGASSQLWFTPSGEKFIGKNSVASDMFFPSGADDEHPRPSSARKPYLCDLERKNRVYLLSQKILQSRNLESGVNQSHD